MISFHLLFSATTTDTWPVVAFGIVILNFILQIVILFRLFYRPFWRWIQAKSNISAAGFRRLIASEKKQIAVKISNAVKDLAQSSTGALITLKKFQSLDTYVNLGVMINADVNAELISCIFDKHSVLHDGSIIIDGNKIVAVSCYFPASKKNLPSSYGSRHRAALGISEETDALCILVSETNGHMAYAKNGKLNLVDSPADFVSIIFNHISESHSFTGLTNKAPTTS